MRVMTAVNYTRATDESPPTLDPFLTRTQVVDHVPGRIRGEKAQYPGSRYADGLEWGWLVVTLPRTRSVCPPSGI
jgi:hypothetical protein